MLTSTAAERTFEEKLIFATICGTWPLYLVGGVYIAGPVLAVMLGSIVAWRSYAGEYLPAANHIAPPSTVIWIWLAAMALMLLALVVGHFQEGLGLAKTVKSAIGWAKGWLLLALFPLAGACLSIHLQLLCRANGWFALTTLTAIPVLLFASFVGLSLIHI